MEQGKVKFIRKGGRIIPVRGKGGKSAGSGGKEPQRISSQSMKKAVVGESRKKGRFIGKVAGSLTGLFAGAYAGASLAKNKSIPTALLSSVIGSEIGQRLAGAAFGGVGYVAGDIVGKTKVYSLRKKAKKVK